MPTNTLDLRARIEEISTIPDGWVESWSTSDSFGAYSQQLSLQAVCLFNFQVGNEVTLYAGYLTDRIHIVTARIDEITETRTADDCTYSVSARDNGARELDSIRITRTFQSTPTTNMPTAHEIIREIAAQVNLNVGALEFPDYSLHNSYVALGKTFQQIVSELIEPFNQFARIQHVLSVRDRVASVIRVDWANPPANGISIEEQHLEERVRQQTAYLDQPRLNEVDVMVIRGASYTTPRVNLGTQTRIEYFRNIATAEAEQSIAGQVSAPGDVVQSITNPGISKNVTVETVVNETYYGDKVLERIETVYADGEITGRTKDRFFYIDPGDNAEGLVIPGSVTAIVRTSEAPNESSLPWVTTSRREGIIERNGVDQFVEVFRGITQYYYDTESQVACECHTTQEFDEDAGAWGISQTSIRTHSQQTGATVRTQLSSFTFEDSKFKIDSVDVQNVGGTRPDPTNIASRKNVLTHQVQAPQGDFDLDGNPIDPGEGRISWTYENPYIGQSVADDLYQSAQDEKTFQVAGYKWETLNFTSVFNPNIRAATPATIEVSAGVSKEFWIESVNHTFSTNAALTTGTAKRLTLDDL